MHSIKFHGYKGERQTLTCVIVSGPHSVKTASIGTLGRTRTPMPVIVPSAPDGSEGIRLHEDAGSVSTFASKITRCTNIVQKLTLYKCM